MNIDNLSKILEQHMKWRLDTSTGCRADLTGADLTGAYLSGTNLTGAYLTGADLTGADLTGAYLSGADIFQFQAGKFHAFYHISSAYKNGNYLKIGCEGHSLAHWLEHGREIGKKAGFAAEEIELHMLVIEKVLPKIVVLCAPDIQNQLSVTK